MKFNRITILLAGLLLVSVISPAEAELTKSGKISLFNQANEAFRQANSAKDPEQTERLYEKAVLIFEKIINEGEVENSKLYYNLGNAYFLNGQLGKAILNYRRANKLDSSDENIQKNLTFARSKRTDKITVKTEKRVMHTLFFWHYDFSVKTKFILTCIFFSAVCLCITAIIWFGRNNLWAVSGVICFILAVCFLGSVFIESGIQADKACGIITVTEVTARQGDGRNYSPSFKESLHEGTEFDLLEHRTGWFHIKLSDDSKGWIPDDSAELI